MLEDLEDRYDIESARESLSESDERMRNPRPKGCRNLEREDGLYRVRIGDYRVVYLVEDARLVILKVRVGHRRDVYR